MELTIEINSAKDLDFLKDQPIDQIEKLELFFYTNISLKFIEKIRNLRCLSIAGSVKDLSPLANCQSLQLLSISNRGAVNTLDFVQGMELVSLRLEGFTSKIDHLSVPHLPSLRNLEISSVSKMGDLSFLRDFSGLERIALFELNSKKLFDFAKLDQLSELRLTNMFQLKDLAELKTIPKLKTLYIHEFYINRKIKVDKKAELLKIVADLNQIDEIVLTINGESSRKVELLAELKK
ncbi:hypothetical protein [Sphingobacterium sp. HMA12]|uniref:hypothetical protein n=1 Tax=Sphingobacterium sp. HMA12 TaxID=2050894 RepID=UPI000CEA0A7E|nr:hypothetical protein [Sphingobacterium sp. HMA12]